MNNVVNCVIYASAFILVGLTILKDINTYNNRKIIEDAIDAYYTHRVFTDKLANWAILYHMEPYHKTLERWWDWGYTRIVPPEDFEMIKDYVKKNKGV